MQVDATGLHDGATKPSVFIMVSCDVCGNNKSRTRLRDRISGAASKQLREECCQGLREVCAFAIVNKSARGNVVVCGCADKLSRVAGSGIKCCKPQKSCPGHRAGNRGQSSSNRSAVIAEPPEQDL